MKRNFRKVLRSGMSILLVFCMVIGFFPASVFADDTQTINYVSLGDSMTNGYCFEGYEQGEDGVIDFLNGSGVYGNGAYPLQFEEWLEDQGYTVNHTMLAPSAMRAEDLYYLLGGREEPNDDWQNQVNGYTCVYDDAILAAHYQTAVAEADLITMCMGNASFGAYMLHRVTDALGLFGAELDEDETVDLEDALIDLDEEQKQIIMELYNDMVAEFAYYVPADLAEQYNVDVICDLIAYTAAGFLLNYKGCLNRIVELNPDTEVILIGLMNTTYGMEVTMDGMESVPVGDIMDGVFDVLNAYIAALPTVMQAAGEWQDAKFYYAEQPEPKFISQEFANLKAADWENIDNNRLSGQTVRERNITAYNDSLRGMIASAFSNDEFTLTLPEITLDDVYGFEESEPSWTYASHGFSGTGDDAKNLSVAIYLGIENAVAESTDTLEIPLESLMTIATDIASVFANLELDVTKPEVTPARAREILGDYLTSTDVLRGMCKIYALFKVGNGMSVHPTPTGHDEIAQTVITAYSENHTAQDQTIANLTKAAQIMADLAVEYYDEAYAYAYACAAENGYVGAAVDSIQTVIEALTNIDLSDAEMTEEFKAEVAGEVEEIVETLVAAQNLLLNADQLDAESLAALIATLDEGGEAIENLLNVLNQAGEDTLELAIIPALEAAHEKLVNEVIPEVTQKLTEAVEAGTAYIMEQAQEAYDALVDATVAAAEKYAPEVADWIYNWLYNNPDKVIAFFNEYGDDAVEFLSEYAEEIMAVLGYLVYTYGEDVAEAVMDNADEILSTMAQWLAEHGENTWELIEVYLNELGIIGAIEEGIAAATAALEALLAQLDAAIYGEVIAAVEERLGALEELAAQAEALGVDITAELEALNAAIGELQTAIETMISQGAEDAQAALEQAAGDISAAMDAILDALEDKATAEINALAAQINGMLTDLTEMANDVQTGINNALEELGGLLDQINNEIYGDLAETIEALLGNLETLIAEAEAVGAAIQPELEALYQAVENLQGVVETLVAEGAAAANQELQQAITDIAIAVENIVAAMSEDASAAVAGVVADINALLSDLYLDATTAEYEITEDSYYVAIGDGTAVSESYVDLLAAELGVDYNNLAEEGQMIQDAGAVIAANVAEIEKADLITVGYGNNTFINGAIETLAEQLVGGTVEFDWSALVTEDGVQYVEQALAELEAQLIEAGIEGEVMTGLDAKVAVMTLVEAYAYAATAYAVSMPEVINAIHEINPEALVIVVGMYNPMDGVVLDLGNDNVIDLGEYLDYLVAGVTVHGTAYSMISGNAIFVEAPAVDVENDVAEMTMTQLFVKYFYYHGADFYPSEDGHEYIKTQILNALTIDEEETAGLLGDADSNGVVNTIDARLVLQYYTRAITENDLDLSVCDVDGNGVVNTIDARLILQYYTKAIEKFPVEA